MCHNTFLNRTEHSTLPTNQRVNQLILGLMEMLHPLTQPTFINITSRMIKNKYVINACTIYARRRKNRPVIKLL